VRPLINVHYVNRNDGSTPGRGGVADRLTPGIWKIIAVTVAGAFMAQLSTTMVNVSLSSPGVELHANVSGDPVGDQRLSVGAGPDAAAKRLAGRTHRRQGAVSVVLLRFHALLGPMRHRLVCKCTDRIPNSARLERRADGTDDAEDDHARCWDTGHHFLPAERPRRNEATRLVLFLYGSDHLGERVGQIILALSVVLLAMFFMVAIRKGDRALIDLRLFKGVAILACARFLRGVGLSAVGIPSISAAYASVKKRDLPMATTSLNILQRLGGR
jgi:MFS family permease